MKLFIRGLVLFFCSIAFVQAATSYEQFVKDKQIYSGYFSFYVDENAKVFLEIDKLEQDFLFQSSLPHGVGSNDIGLDRGQLGDTRLVRFEQVGDKVFLRQLNTYYRADTKNVLEKQAIDEAFASSIIWGFPVSHRSKDGTKVLIDYTPFLLSDIHQLSKTLKQKKQGNFAIDLSRSAIYPKRMKAFPENTELEARVTFKGDGAGRYLRSVTPDETAITVNLHHSLVKLPDENYSPRKFHPYSGYWETSYADYASAIDEPLIKRNIPRHRLYKKNPQAGVSEAIEPIVYYVDAGVPEPIRSALIEGASWWNQAFDAAGYKDAFQVKMLPSEADPMDVRYNVIQWVHRATRGWSYGSSVIDPRTGEIIKGHVTLGSLRVRQDYLIAVGMTSPFTSRNTNTQKMKAMALARIRQLSAHEVGHTLGIAHNFAASTNDRASVMDYPHPLITIENDSINLENAYATGIGAWDKFVIAYGYADVNASEESKYLARIIDDAQQTGLLYASDPDARANSSSHSTAHLWDNGNDATKELKRVLALRALALKNFGLNSIPYDTPLSELEQVLVPIYNFHRFQVAAAAKIIAGVDYYYAIKNDVAKAPFKIVSGKQQKAALSALLETLSVETLLLPNHIEQLIPPKAYGYYRNRESFVSRTGITFDAVTAAEASAKHTLSLLLDHERLARLQQQSMHDNHIPSVAKLLETLIENTLEMKVDKSTALIQQRVNQQVIEHLLVLWHSKNTVPEVRSEVFYTLNQTMAWLNDKSNSRKYRLSRAHFSLLASQIKSSLTHEKEMVPSSKVTLPPGSPIGGY